MSVIANEEAELYSRILKNKKKVMEIPYKMAKHYTPYYSNKNKALKILLSKRNLGIGQGLRHAIRSKSTFSFIKKFKYLFFTILLDILTIISLVYNLRSGCNIALLIAFILQITIGIVNITKRRWYWYFLDKITELYLVPGIVSYKKM